KYMYTLHSLAKFLKKDFDKVNEKDMRKLFIEIDSMDYTLWTINDFKVTVKKFYKVLNHGKYPEYIDWIKTSMKNSETKLPNDLLKEKDITELINACIHPRDKAIIAVLYESGARAGELLSMCIRDVDFDENGAKIAVIGKTGARCIRLISSTPFLSTWIQNHPQRDNPESYLWVNVGSTHRGAPLGYPAFTKMIKTAGRLAKINKKLHPHLFRHSRATYLANKLTEAQL
ncbi:unnamed protein product, partial [marine sediment metagenome]